MDWEQETLPSRMVKRQNDRVANQTLTYGFPEHWVNAGLDWVTLLSPLSAQNKFLGILRPMNRIPRLDNVAPVRKNGSNIPGSICSQRVSNSEEIYFFERV